MSNLISGKEALIALANGEEVQIRFKKNPTIGWCSLGTIFLQSVGSVINGADEFRLKPKTIMLNGVEIPAPFEPKEGDVYYHIYPSTSHGFGWNHFSSKDEDSDFIQFGAWKTEAEIKQVVEALRSAFK